MKALFFAVRAEDGRGQETLLREAVREHFQTGSVAEVTEAVHFGRLAMNRIHELAPVLLRVASAGDRVALTVVDRLAQEVFLMARVAVDRLRLVSEPTDIVLGGGVLASRQPQLVNRASERIRSYAPLANVVVVDHPPVVGAALLGLDALGAPTVAEAKIRDALLGKISGSAESVSGEGREQGVPLAGGDLVPE